MYAGTIHHGGMCKLCVCVCACVSVHRNRAAYCVDALQPHYNNIVGECYTVCVWLRVRGECGGDASWFVYVGSSDLRLQFVWLYGANRTPCGCAGKIPYKSNTHARGAAGARV